MRFLTLSLLLVRCATVPQPVPITEENGVKIRYDLQDCLNKDDREYCFDRADNACLNADLEPDCHGVDR